jgi:hypothetical protein
MLPGASRLAPAQSYPARPVHLISSFAAGGPSDLLARLIGQWRSERLGQPFIIDNRPGAGGNIGAEAAAKAPPDGYTLLMVAPANVVNVTLYDKLDFNFMRDIVPEPFAKRTVEGDLGIRCNAATILRRVGDDRLHALFQEMFPELATSRADLTGYIDHISADAGSVPREDWQSAADATLARVAVDVAIERHVGRREAYYARTGTIMLQAGKDLTEVPTVIGTGGIFAHNPYAGRIMAGAAAVDGAGGVLRPARASVRLDQDYVLYAVGLLSDSHPAVALALFEDHLRPDGRRPRAGQPDQGHMASHAADRGHSCCS